LPATKEAVRSPEARVRFGVSHRTRIEILCLLNEGTYSPSQLTERVGEPLTTVSHHIKALLESGCIELARTEKVRNADQHFYRAIKLPMISDEEAEALPPEVKQEYASVILQGVIAESLDALGAEKLNCDPNVRMMWRWFNLDAQGRQELADEQRESFERIMDIEARSTARRIGSNEDPKTMIAVLLGFERNRAVGAATPGTHQFSPQEKSE
jgi:DNA-binding transcriptional ArsR family regulator